MYALGCVLYEILSGSVPFPRDSELAKLYAHVNDPPPPLQGVPASLAAAVSRAMAKAPADRFLSAGDFLGSASRGGGAAGGDRRGRRHRHRFERVGEDDVDRELNAGELDRDHPHHHDDHDGHRPDHHDRERQPRDVGAGHDAFKRR